MPAAHGRLLGVVAGVPLSIATGRALAGALFGVGPVDAAALLTAVVVLLLTAMAAAVLPALRAARVDPVAALRSH
jgi:ABC-type antimicrobial peptide transport system permease subunit